MELTFYILEQDHHSHWFGWAPLSLWAAALATRRLHAEKEMLVI